MYPYKVFMGLDLYTLLMVAGVVVALVFIRLQGDKRGLRAAFQNLLIVDTVLTVFAGYGAAVLFQAYYNYRANGTFEIVSNTGATFYGGLIGGTAAFIIIYFVGGYLIFPDNYHKKNFRTVADLAAACIAVGHGIGRLGCLMAGCCHGKVTDAWYGITMHIPHHTDPVKVIPVQLYEAIFLLALSGILLWLFMRGKKYLLSIYMISYAVWRFFAEMMRGDYRGTTVVDNISPSQYLSIIIFFGGIMLLCLQMFVDAGRKDTTDATPSDETSEEISEEASEETSEETPAEISADGTETEGDPA